MSKRFSDSLGSVLRPSVRRDLETVAAAANTGAGSGRERISPVQLLQEFIDLQLAPELRRRASDARALGVV